MISLRAYNFLFILLAGVSIFLFNLNLVFMFSFSLPSPDLFLFHNVVPFSPGSNGLNRVIKDSVTHFLIYLLICVFYFVLLLQFGCFWYTNLSFRTCVHILTLITNNEPTSTYNNNNLVVEHFLYACLVICTVSSHTCVLTKVTWVACSEQRYIFLAIS